jgi:threonine/homoserine/homoserine lactone efflux protein
VTNLLNPKIGVFYLAVLPQFLPRGAAPLVASTAMALIHDIEGMAWFTVLILLVARAARWFTRPAVKRRLDQLTGLVFIGFGVRLAAFSR